MYYIVKSVCGHLYYVNEKHSLSKSVTDALEFESEEAAKQYYENHLVHQNVDYAIIDAALFANSFVIGIRGYYDANVLYLKDFEVSDMSNCVWTFNKKEASVFLPRHRDLFEFVKSKFSEAKAIWKTKILF
jgi:hypothetical protein